MRPHYKNGSAVLPRLRPSSTPSRPAFEHKPLASTRSGSTSLGSMRNPAQMTSSELGLACVAAAREHVDSAQFWSLLVDRAQQLDLDPRDTALLLNGLSRTRKLVEFPKLLEELWPRMQLDYFSSVQLAMTLSAVAKSSSQLVVPGGMVAGLVHQVKTRVHEFATPLEFSMVLNAISKLGINDTGLFQRLSSFVQSRMALSESFHARELSVIASAFAGAKFRDTVLFDKILQRCQPTLPEATPVEFARLLAAFAKVGFPLDELITAANQFCADRFKYMSPVELRNTIFAFGTVCECVDPTTPGLSDILAQLRAAFLVCFPLFQPRDVAAVLVSLGRWRIRFSDSEMTQLVEKLKKMRIDSQSAIAIAGSLQATTHNTVTAPNWTNLIWEGLSVDRGELDPGQCVRAIVACLESESSYDKPVEALITDWVVRRISQIDRPSRLLLADVLVVKLLSAESDLVLLLRSS